MMNLHVFKSDSHCCICSLSKDASRMLLYLYHTHQTMDEGKSDKTET